jgi:uncharacterized protein (TIGR03437 family)
VLHAIRFSKRGLGLEFCFPALAFLSLISPAIAASFSGVGVTDTGTPVSGARIIWSNQGVCNPPVPFHNPVCLPPTVTGSATTGQDGSFSAANLPAGIYNICLYPVADNQLASCVWQGFGESGPASITLAADQNLNNLKLILRSGCRVVISVKDDSNAISRYSLRVGVVIGIGGYYGATFDQTRQGYTVLVPKAISAHISIDTILLAQDTAGNNLPIDTATLPFTTAGDEVPISIAVTPALVNAASYVPGIMYGEIATLFGTGFTDVPGVQPANLLPLPTQIGGTTVTVNGIAAPLFAIASQNGVDQINFQVPHDPSLSVGPVAIVVNNNGKTQTFYTKYWDSILGVFSTLVHLDGTPITASNPAHAGEQIVIYWTGMSGFNFVYSDRVFFIPDGIPAPPSTPCVSYFDPTVQISGVAADVASCTAAPGLVGVGQLVVTIPANLQSGSNQVSVSLDGIPGNLVQLLVQ